MTDTSSHINSSSYVARATFILTRNDGNAENGKNAEDGNDNPLVVSHGSLRFFDDIHSTTYLRRYDRIVEYDVVLVR